MNLKIRQNFKMSIIKTLKIIIELSIEGNSNIQNHPLYTIKMNEQFLIDDDIPRP